MSHEASGAEPDLIASSHGSLGVITLNRPRALNALTPGMVAGMAQALDVFEADRAVAAVVVLGAGERAFCAGGDIRLMHEFGRGGRLDEALAFWRDEYHLNRRIHRYPKPFVALIDGIVMGGGVGVSLHGSHRVAGPRYLFAMPEVGIGFFPDVGSSHVLSRLPGAMGAYLAVTGARIGRAEAIALGLATHAVGSGAFPAMIAALALGEPLDTVLGAHAEPVGENTLAVHAKTIAAVFSAETLGELVARLGQRAAAGDAFCAETVAGLAGRSPTSMAVALEQVRRARNLTFEEAVRMDYRVVSRIARGHDFYEGVRAVILDKDHAPKWQPATIAELDSAAIAAHFAPVPDDLMFDDEEAQ